MVNVPPSISVCFNPPERARLPRSRVAMAISRRLRMSAPAQHRHDQAVVEGDRNADIRVRVVGMASVDVGAVGLGMLDQRHRAGAHDQIVDADLLAGGGEALR